MKQLGLILIYFNIQFNVIGQSNPTRLIPVLKLWAKGKADSIYHFNQNHHSHLVTPMLNAYQVKRAREYWYNKNMNSFIHGDKNWQSVTDFLGRFKTLIGIYRANIDDIEQTIGGFTVHIFPQNRDSIRFVLVDVKSRWSLFFHLPFVKNKPFNSNYPKRMQNMVWQFEWVEPVKTELFYQRQMNLLFKKQNYSGYLF